MLLSTSTGLKDPGSSASHLSDLPVLEPTLAALEAALPRACTDDENRFSSYEFDEPTAAVHP